MKSNFSKFKKIDTTKTFEESMNELNLIVSKLEEGKMELDEMMASYVEGLELVTLCQYKLSAAQDIMNLEIEFDGKKFIEKKLVLEDE